MNLDTITADIAAARLEFHALNDLHWTCARKPCSPALQPLINKLYPDKASLVTVYKPIAPADEARLCELADSIARLERFVGWLRIMEWIDGPGLKP
jgi:hypothetical protein